jgi:general secretion pathway protein C
MSSLTDHLYRLSRSPVAASWVARVGGAVAVMALAQLCLLVAAGPQLPFPPARATAPAALDSGPLAKWHLFGIPNAGVVLQATTLSLVLRGTVATDRQERAVAILAEKGRPDAGYHVGDRLPGGGVLQAVHADHVVIANGGTQERLALVDPLARPQPAPRRSSVVVASAGPVPPPAMPSAVGDLSVLPVLENGRVVGARLATPDVARIERLGLRRDDVIVSIDGTAVADPAINRTLEKGLLAGRAMTLIVRRDGRERTVRIAP